MIRVAFSVVGFLVAFIFSPLSFSDTTALRSAEIELAKMSYHLQKCRESCLTNCRASGASTCSEDVCDRGMCKTAKQAYDMSKQAHTRAQQALQAAQRQALINQNQSLTGKNQAIKGGAKSALKHTKEARENMGLYVVMGVGTTALLTYMAAKCCKAAFGGGGSSSVGSSGNSVSSTAGKSAGNKVPSVAPKPTQTIPAMSPTSIDPPPSPPAFAPGNPTSGLKLEKEDSKTTLKRFYTWMTGAGLDLCARPLQWAVPSAEATGLPCSQVWCPIYAGGAVVAGLQTVKMYKQRQKLKKIEESLCEKDAQTGVCSDSESGTQLAQTKWAEVPGCGGNSVRCQQTLCAIDPADPLCSHRPGSQSYRAGLTPPPIDSSEKGLPDRLSTIYAPQGGWPQNQNPFVLAQQTRTANGVNARKPVVYNLTPSEQQALNKALHAHNQQQQAYLNNMGADAPEGIKISSLFGQKINPGQAGVAGSGPAETGTYFESEDAVAGQARSPSGSNTESGVLSGSPPRDLGQLARRELSLQKLLTPPPPQRGQKGSLKQEMDHILNKYYQDGRGQNDPYQGKFTEVGSSKTPVGLKDDNLFLMSHRLHRRMSSDQAFLSYPVNDPPSATGAR